MTTLSHPGRQFLLCSNSYCSAKKAIFLSFVKANRFRYLAKVGGEAFKGHLRAAVGGEGRLEQYRCKTKRLRQKKTTETTQQQETVKFNHTKHSTTTYCKIC